MCAALLAACPEKARPKADPNAVATINGDVVSKGEFETELTRELQAMEGVPPRSPEQTEPFKQALLETLIERAVLLQAAKAAQVSVTPDEVDRRVLALASEYPAESFDAALAQGQTTRTELEKKTREQLIIEKLFDKEVYARVAVTEDQIRRYFDEHGPEFVEPEQVRASQIVVKGLDDAKKLQQQLWAGKKFPDLARRYSLGPEARVGGDLGWFPRGVMPAQFDEQAFKLPVGQVSEVVSTDFGFHLFKVMEKKPARKRELPEVRGQIEKRLLGELREKAQKDYVKSLRAGAVVAVNNDALQTVSTHPMRAKAVEP
ncbi:MAG: peptidyl-prolyl cis-trans isomerase [Archangiaceae bacterium]|nr:peptidyl-prolyl cis-trans isomerase [Archangiaceae bacterium]